MKIIYHVLLVGLVLFTGCVEEPIYDVTPEIEFQNLNKDEINTAEDSLVIQFSFKDGDGDLGTKQGDPEISLYLIDQRTGFPYSYQVPFINLKGSSTAISGNVWVTLEPGVIHCRPNRPDFDTIQYKVYIIDRAGHESNRVSTPPVILQCQ